MTKKKPRNGRVRKMRKKGSIKAKTVMTNNALKRIQSGSLLRSSQMIMRNVIY